MKTGTKGGDKAIVTGGAGFIGSHLVDVLIAGGYRVHVVDDLSCGRKEHVHPDATLHEASICDYGKIAPIFKGSSLVFHAAALPRVAYSIEHPLESNEANVTGTVNVLTAARKGGAKRVVYSSSSSVYGEQRVLPLREDMPANPQSPYGLQKYIGELYCKTWSLVYGLETVSLRYFNVYGPRLNPEGAYALVIGKFLQQKARGAPLTITGDGTQTRDFTHVRDVVRANILAAENAEVGTGEAINIGAGRNVSINKTAELIGGSVEYVPARLEPHDTLADNSKAQEILGWKPEVTLEEGIGELKSSFKID